MSRRNWIILIVAIVVIAVGIYLYNKNKQTTQAPNGTTDGNGGSTTTTPPSRDVDELSLEQGGSAGDVLLG